MLKRINILIYPAVEYLLSILYNTTSSSILTEHRLMQHKASLSTHTHEKENQQTKSAAAKITGHSDEELQMERLQMESRWSVTSNP